MWQLASRTRCPLTSNLLRQRKRWRASSQEGADKNRPQRTGDVCGAHAVDSSESESFSLRKDSMRAATALVSFVSHSQITIVLQPRSVSASSFRLSLRTFPSNFFVQYSTRVFGLEAKRQLGCRCQKHPCTWITARYLGNTMSGQPGRSLRCSLKRNPSPWAIRRTSSSGLVSRPRMRDMISLRFAGSKMSAISFRDGRPPLPESVGVGLRLQ